MNRLKFLGLASLFSGLALLNACAKTASSGTSQVSLQIGSLSAANQLIQFLLPEARAAVTSAKVCFKKVKFKTEEELNYMETEIEKDSESDRLIKEAEIEKEEEVEFRPGEVELSSSGIEIGTVTLPEGTYTQIEFILEKDGRGCSGNNSVDLVNTSGMFTTPESIEIKLAGRFIASEANQVLSLNMNDILMALDQVTSNNQIKDKLENLGVKGHFE